MNIRVSVCNVIHIKNGLPCCVTGSSMITDPGSLTQVRGETEYPGVGIPHPFEYWGGWQSFVKTYLIYTVAQVFFTLFWRHHCAAIGILCQREVMSSSWKCWPLIRSTTHNPLLHQPLLLVHAVTLTAVWGLKPQFKKFCWGYHLY